MRTTTYRRITGKSGLADRIRAGQAALGIALVSATCGSLVGCTPSHVTWREVQSVSGGGAGEAWVVLKEVSGQVGTDSVDENRYVVHRCTPEGCRAVGAIQGSEKTAQGSEKTARQR